MVSPPPPPLPAALSSSIHTSAVGVFAPAIVSKLFLPNHLPLVPPTPPSHLSILPHLPPPVDHVALPLSLPSPYHLSASLPSPLFCLYCALLRFSSPFSLLHALPSSLSHPLLDILILCFSPQSLLPSLSLLLLLFLPLPFTLLTLFTLSFLCSLHLTNPSLHSPSSTDIPLPCLRSFLSLALPHLFVPSLSQPYLSPFPSLPSFPSMFIFLYTLPCACSCSP